jgi:6,7-dimethyl-8-ribityllumazine synthase
MNRVATRAAVPVPVLDGTHLHVGLVVSRYNWEITGEMLLLARQECLEQGVAPQHIAVHTVPGAFEIPLMAQALLRQGKLDALLCLGCVMKGETRHDIVIGDTVAQALQRLALEYQTPVIFGVQCAENQQQAQARIVRARETARAMIEMATLLQEIRRQ